MIIEPGLFKICHTGIEPNPGCLLISAPFLDQLYFKRSVILLIDDMDNSVMGLIQNKPSRLFLNNIISGLEDIDRIPIFYGGPLQEDRLFYIHNLGDLIPNSIKISDNLYIDGDFNTVMSYLKSNQNIDGNIKFFLGYSGWSRNQLLNEIEDDTWLVSENNSNYILNQKGDEMWNEALSKLDSKFRQWLKYPKETYLN
ncbi:MAG: YqgE/AlgH family protein [Bacteroidales bacterium]|nr:YqgE/AlgH family protein [Bacteroidales bacterium]